MVDEYDYDYPSYEYDYTDYEYDDDSEDLFDEWAEAVYDDDGDDQYHPARRELIAAWFRRTRYTVSLHMGDPLALFRRCADCGKRGCVPREKFCFEHWILF